MKRFAIAAAAASIAVALSTGTALAQHHDMNQGGMMMNHGMMKGAPAAANESASTKAFRAANAAMHKDMDIAYTGNIDIDFVRGMIPHHEGAIAMAKVLLANSKDAELRKLAEDIIKAQEGEIAWMKDWLKKHGS